MTMLQFISHQTDKFSYLDGIRMALQGGCKWIQLRMKGASAGEIEPVALEAIRLCRESGAVFIIDDHVELVVKVHADGVHLGKKDMPVGEARRILGQDYIIGATANTFEDVRKAVGDGASYIGCGPFRFTTTKKGLAPVLGIEGLSDITGKMKTGGIDIPTVAIGGITAGDIPAVMGTGVTGIALSGAILNASDPVEETRRIIKILNGWKN